MFCAASAGFVVAFETCASAAAKLRPATRTRRRHIAAKRAEPHSNNLTMSCFHLGGRAFHSRSLPPTQKGCAALHKSSAGERHTKKANLLQRSRHPIRVPSTPALAHAPPTRKAHRALTQTSAHLTFDSRATHARTLLPAALAYVPFGFVLVRVRVCNCTGKQVVLTLLRCTSTELFFSAAAASWRRGQQPGHHDQVPATHDERCLGQRTGHHDKTILKNNDWIVQIGKAEY
jgi:hypothetical protein